MSSSCLSITRYFIGLKDPRVRGRCDHRLLDIVVIAICGVIAGCDTFKQIERFGHRRRDWLEGLLPLPGGIPSHDTFERLFARLDPRRFARCFERWTQSLCDALGLEHVAIDGKTLRGSGNAAEGLGPLHLVSAWSTKNQLSLGQVAVDEKSNEITAIPKLLELLEIEGALVSIDAMGCQKKIAQKIVAKGADFVLSVKDNQPHLREDVHRCFLECFEHDFANVEHDSYQTEERRHGRHELRSYTVIYDPPGIRHLEDWPGLCVIGLCYSERTEKGKTTTEHRYFIGSRRTGAQAYGEALRGHWGIENNLHWQLDVSFSEDASRIQQRNAAENFSTLRRMVLSALKRHPSKASISTKRLESAWDTDFLEEVLKLMAN